MKHSTFTKLMLLTMLIVNVACHKEIPEEEKAKEIALKFCDAFYNLDIQKAKEYCVEEMEPVMNFRRHNLRASDYEARKAAGKAKARVIDMTYLPDNERAYFDVEISNFLKIDYMNNTTSILPADTVKIYLKKAYHGNWIVYLESNNK